LINDLTAHGTRRYLKATALKHLTVPVLQALYDGFVEFSQHVGPASVLSVCVFEYFPRQAFNSRPRDSTAYNNRGDWFNITLSPNWGDEVEFDQYARDWVHRLVEKIGDLEKADEVVKPGEEVVEKHGYFNGSMGDEKSTIVYGDNYPRLRELKKKYDPEFVFRKWYPIVPAA
jgi:Berberine and berberine like